MHQSNYGEFQSDKPYIPVPNLIPNNPHHFQPNPSSTHFPTPYPPPDSGVYSYPPNPNPNPIAQAIPNWVVSEAPQLQYQQAIPPLYQDTTALASSDNSLTSICSQQKIGSQTFRRKLKRPIKFPMTSVGQHVRCELCKIECNDIQLYQQHLSGKKHAKNIQKSYAAALATISAMPTSQSINNVSVSGSGDFNTEIGQWFSGVQTVPADLESKKQKLLEGGVAVQSVKVCSVCNIVCNGEIAFADHIAGKKHLAQVRALYLVPNSIPDGSIRCDVCNINCASSEGLNNHIQRKKHIKNLKKLVDSTSGTISSSPSITQRLTNLPTGALQTTETTTGEEVPEPQSLNKKGQNKEPEDDIEAKKRKILECGATETDVKACDICNVVCNSEMVFKTHLAGHKHKTTAKRLKISNGS